MKLLALRGALLSFKKDPFLSDPDQSYDFMEDALVVIKNGLIDQISPYSDNAAKGLDLTDYSGSLICPGFIDCHVHYPQSQMIGAYGEQLIEWLNTYTFVAEQDFKDKNHAGQVATFFLRELLRSGTTTAAVYCTVHPQSVDAFFEESLKFNTRMIAGKVLMNRNAPEALLDTVESSYDDSKKLLKKWHRQGRQLYCITPRFAPTSTNEQLAAAGRLWQENPGTYLQTHLNENLGEVAWVKELFPDSKNYFDVYHHFGLTGPRSIFGHCVHNTEEELEIFHQTGSAIAHCPTSNMFLGSGLFKIFEAKRKDRPVRVGLGTDLGAGTSFCHLQTLSGAYKMAQLSQNKLSAIHAFYLATRGGAEALYLDDKIGSVAPGYEADLTIIDFKATPLLDFRQSFSKTLLEKLFVMMILGDDRAIRATYVAGQAAYDRERKESFSYAR